MRRFLIVVSAVFAVVILGWVALIGAVYAWGGVATVSVQDPHEGVHVYVPVPMAMVDAALTTGAWVVPDEEWLDVEVELGEWGEWAPMVQGLLDELERMPDTTLVEVEEGDTFVKIFKENGKLKIRVEEEELSVRVSVPMRSARRTLSRVVSMI